MFNESAIFLAGIVVGSTITVLCLRAGFRAGVNSSYQAKNNMMPLSFPQGEPAEQGFTGDIEEGETEE